MHLRGLLGVAILLAVSSVLALAQPPGGPGGPPPGGPGGPPGGPGGPPSPGQLLMPFEADALELTEKQRAAVERLQKDFDGRFKKLLTADQRKKLDEMRNRGPGRPGEGGPGGDEHADLTSAHGIMHRIGEGPTALHGQIGQALGSDAPNWDELKGWSKEYVDLASALKKTSPKRGEPESWQDLTARYAASAETLDQAVAASDKPSASAAHESLSQSCMACHQAHRPMRGPGGPPGGNRNRARRPMNN